ncbi:hypothetical protein [Streptomyces sp. NPDC052701]|uniref:hypothetical protein n=1 Tax=Streptomyces sp. NPDC052701 TaxID=3155533 RepID=UPI0034129DEE
MTAKVVVTRDGMVDIELAIEDDGTAPARTVAQDGPLCYPVQVSPVRGTAGAGTPARYWMVLDRASSAWTGRTPRQKCPAAARTKKRRPTCARDRRPMPWTRALVDAFPTTPEMYR